MTTIAVTAANQLLLPRSLFFKEVQKQRIELDESLERNEGPLITP